jgi:23S rRNA (guanosine2251-2'-O)-methyltransferase
MEAAVSQGEVRWVCGVHAVSETLRARPKSIRAVWIEHEGKNPAIGGIVKAARAAGLDVKFVARNELDRAASGGRHQGVAAKVFSEAEEIFSDYLEILSDEDKKDLVLVALDQIQDPHNLGAIARSAVNLGAKGLIIPERRAAPVTPAVVSASAGAIEKIRLFRVVNLAQALTRAKEAGFWVYGADAAGKPAWSVSMNRPLILVIGSEGYGMRRLTQELCDELVSVPQSKAGVSSFNASCAASMLLYEAARQAAKPS